VGAIARGDLNQRVEVKGEDEISQLATCFNVVIERLDQADRARKAFIANVSHELRTPLAIIQGNVERLLEREPPPAEVGSANPAPITGDSDPDRLALELIQRETTTLNRLIGDLFTLARLEEATLPLQPVPLRLDEVVGQAVESLRAAAWDQRRVTVQSLVQADKPPVLADRTRLGQILNNLALQRPPSHFGRRAGHRGGGSSRGDGRGLGERHRNRHSDRRPRSGLRPLLSG
jgi:two-component system, OmpR family, sensor histidine kinase BaeS